MSLSFSIDRILSPDFGPCKSRSSTIYSVEGLCKSEDFSYKKLVADTRLRLEMPPATEMHAGASLLCQMMSAFPGHSVWIKPTSKFFNSEMVKLDEDEMVRGSSILKQRDPKQNDLEYFHVASATSDDVKVTDSTEKQSNKVIEDILDQKVNYDQNTPPLMDYLDQPNSLLPYRLSPLAQCKPLSGNNNVVSPTKDTLSSPKKDGNGSIGVKDAHHPFTKSHLEEDIFHTDDTAISCDTKPQVLEELCQNEDWSSSGDGRCSSSSVDTFSSMVENDSNHVLTSTGLTKSSSDDGKIDIKESLSDTCIESPPSNFSDNKTEPSSNLNSKLLSDDLDEIVPPGEGWPVWVYCSRYSARPSSGPRSRRQSRKIQSHDEKRCRTAFTMFQLNKLHMAFESNPYLCEKRRNELARDLQLSESQVKIWFQNRRAKVKKAAGGKNKLAALLKEQGLYNHSTTKT